MHMHSRERPFACSYEGCNKTFCDGGGLIHHENCHINKKIYPRSHESCNQTFSEPFQLHWHHREEHEKATTLVEEIRPIRLRLTQPKRPNSESLENIPRKRLLIHLPTGKRQRSESLENIPPKRLLIRLPMEKRQSSESFETIPRKRSLIHLPTEEILGGSSTSGPTEAHANCSESNPFAKRSTNCVERRKVHQDARPPIYSLSTSSNPEASGNCQGHQGQERESLPLAADVKINRRELPKDSLLRSLVPKPLSSVIEENIGNVEPVYEPLGRDDLLQKDIVRPIHKRRDALRRSNYNPETIARDVLLATGSHPNMDPLNAHLDILRKRFPDVNLDSNIGTFRWDLVGSEGNSEKQPERQPGREQHELERQAEKEVEPQQCPPTASEAKKDKMISDFNVAQRRYDLPFSIPTRPSTKSGVVDHEVPFRVILPDKTHIGPMSTIFSTVFDRDPSARLMSSNEDLWAAIFTMLESRCYGPQFTIRAAVRESTGDVIGWVACHEVDNLQAMPKDSSMYLDWTTAAHLLPSQISRFTSTKESAKEKAKRSNQRKVGQGLALTIKARATEAQAYLVPVRRLVVNALVVHPLLQGHGVASALLGSIIETVGMEKRPIWVQAPEDPAIAQGTLKAGLFRRAGFTCAGELNLDLDSYARERDKGKGASFGTYKWNYMLRWPQSVGPNPSQRRSRKLPASV